MARLNFYNEITTEEGKQVNRWCMGTDGVCFKDIDEFVGTMDAEDNEIDIRIHCVGGLVSEGWAIYDKLRASGKEISCTVEGMCASMATVILLAAPKERRKALQHARLCVHNPYVCGWCLGETLTADDLEASAKNLRADQDRILDLYVERCGCEREQMQALMDEDKYIGTDEAKDLGLISEVIAPASAKKKDVINKVVMMDKEKKVEVKQNLLDKVLAKLGLARIEDVVVCMDLTTADGSTLTVERENGDAQVGDEAKPDGEHLMPDGSTIVVEDGVITEIRPKEEEEKEDEEGEEGGKGEKDEKADEIEALNARIAELETMLAEAKAMKKTDVESEILDVVNVAGGLEWLRAQSSKHTVEGRKVSGVGAKNVDGVTESAIAKELRERREKKFNK